MLGLGTKGETTTSQPQQSGAGVQDKVVLKSITKHAAQLELVPAGVELVSAGDKLDFMAGSDSATVRTALGFLQLVLRDTSHAGEAGFLLDAVSAKVLLEAVEALDTAMASLLQRRGKRLSQLGDASGVKRGSSSRLLDDRERDRAAMGGAFDSYSHIFDQSTQEAVLGYVAAQPKLLSAKERVRKAIRRLGRVALWTRALSMGAKVRAEERAEHLNTLMTKAGSSQGATARVSRGAFRGGSGVVEAELWPGGSPEAAAVKGLGSWTFDIFQRNAALSSAFGEVPTGEHVIPTGTKNKDGTVEFFSADGPQFGRRMLVSVMVTALHRLGVFADTKVQRGTVAAFADQLAGGYKAANPYHNALHAADVTHGMYFFLCPEGGGLAAGARLRPQALLGCILAAAGHDVGHPGVNNPFLIATSDPLALRYNDASPLENMHAATLFEVMKEGTGCDVLAPLHTPERLAVRSMIIKLILATDNSQHFKLKGQLDKRVEGIERFVEVFGVPGSATWLERRKSGRDASGAALPHLEDMEFSPIEWNSLPKEVMEASSKTAEQVLSSGEGGSGTGAGEAGSGVSWGGYKPQGDGYGASADDPLGLDADDGRHDLEWHFTASEDLVLVMSNVLHAADISNPARPWHLYSDWTDRVLEEFYRQGALEVQQDLPVGPLNHRNSPVPRCKMQAGFIRALVLPLYTLIARLPEMDIKDSACAQLDSNMGRWEAEIASLAAAEK